MSPSSRKGFIKSQGTRTPVANSRTELERMLTRYGCTAFTVAQDYATNRALVTFVVPDDLSDAQAPKIPVRLEVRAREVYDALYGQPRTWDHTARAWRHDPLGYNREKLAQAERVAWRQLILWVDAALSAASTGLQKISEAFLAHTLIRDDRGEVRRIVDHMNAIANGGNWRALLARPESPQP